MASTTLGAQHGVYNTLQLIAKIVVRSQKHSLESKSGTSIDCFSCLLFGSMLVRYLVNIILTAHFCLVCCIGRMTVLDNAIYVIIAPCCPSIFIHLISWWLIVAQLTARVRNQTSLHITSIIQDGSHGVNTAKRAPVEMQYLSQNHSGLTLWNLQVSPS